MLQDLSEYRKSYEKGELNDNEVPTEPFKLFESWFRLANDSDGIDEPNAMMLSTIGVDGFPKCRIVLLKSYDEHGFVFYTNYSSEKGKAIEKNDKVALNFFWPAIEKQIIIKGKARKVSAKQSDEYFHSRPKGSQLGAVASNQSNTIESKDLLEERLKNLETEYKEKEVPRPKDWGGYNIQPESIEFWQGRPNRMHDRILYSKKENWVHTRLQP